VSVALFNQHEERTRRIILSSMACPALPHFFTLSRNRQDFMKKVTESKMCFVFLYNFCLKHFSLSEKFSEMLDADKSLARPGRKQATSTEDFDLICV
jgi:hypothetical protein